MGESLAQRKRRTLVAPDMNLSLDQSEGSVLSDDFLETPDDLDINVDDIETPDETDSLEFINNGNDLEWEGEMMLASLLKHVDDLICVVELSYSNACWDTFEEPIKVQGTALIIVWISFWLSKGS